ncbi:MAG: hypothetical protein NTW13_06645 [Candidatus Omnitrophica bacterium]|nr:hypothetical protein [Candidatus Omnitrophota bacterium]
MRFNELKEEIREIKFDKLRTDCDNYFEAVVVKGEINKLHERLHNFFGHPAWPSKDRLSYHMEEAIKGFGGIMPGQTLYFSNHGSDTIFAMLWPWQDGERTTVKIFQK